MITMSDHDNVNDFFEEFKGIVDASDGIDNSDGNGAPGEDLATYYNPKVEMHNEANDLHVIFHDVSPDELENIKNIIRAYRGLSNEFSEYFDHVSSDDEEIDETIGTQHIIPEGKYKGCTIQDAYNYNGHYSLSKLLQTVFRMSSVSKDEIMSLYKEIVQFTVPRIQMKEISLQDFIKVYEPFLKKNFNLDKIRREFQSLDAESKTLLYDRIIENITSRMKKSIE